MEIQNKNNLITLGIVVSIVAIFVFDLYTPLGIAAGVPYVIVILLSFKFESIRVTLTLAIVCSLLVVIGSYYSSSTDMVLWKVITNRSLAILVIWVIAWLCIINIRSNKRRLIYELQTRAILDSVVDSIIVIDGRGIIKIFNPAAEKLFGYSNSEVIGQNIKMLMPEPYQSEHDGYLQNYMKTGEAKIIGIGRELTAKRKDNSTFPIELTITKSGLDNKRFFIGIVRDISRRKLYEEQLIESRQNAEKANLAKSVFLANMSHELRTPLNAIIGYSEMLEEEAKEQAQNQLLADLNKINISGRHLLGLINGILDLSKIEAGKMELSQQRFSLNELLSDVSATIQPVIIKNKNILKTDFPMDDLEMESDPQKIKQILFNLLGNSAKFTSNSEILFSVEYKIKSRPETSINFIVKDSGIGMNQEQLDKVFSAFTQADNDTARKFGGTGLGLTITQKFCEMLGGEITVTSEQGKGTMFTVSIPCVIPEEYLTRAINDEHSEKIKIRSGETPTGDVKELLQETIVVDKNDAKLTKEDNIALIIDNDKNAREMLTFHLNKLHLKVIDVDNGIDGFNIARKLKPKVIILDLKLPHMDGWAVLKMLKADVETADIPVIICSIITDQVDTGLALGATDYIFKPLDKKRLIAVLKKYHIVSTGHLLVVEDDNVTREIIVSIANQENLDVDIADNGLMALSSLENEIPSLILLDLMMPEMDGFKFIEQLQQKKEWAKIPVIVITAKSLTVADRSRLDGFVNLILEKGKYTKRDLIKHISKHVKPVTDREISPLN